MAMAWYACSTTPIIKHLNQRFEETHSRMDDEGRTSIRSTVKQAWFADDATVSGSIDDLSTYWKELLRIGPNYGYFPNPTKTVLIVKPDTHERATEIFGDSGVIITSDGQRQLGAALGSEDFRTEYVTKKVKGWIEEVKTLAKAAESDPHSAYAAFTYGMVHKWGFFQRTIPAPPSLYQPLEDVLKVLFIPKITGRGISDLERSLLALPCRLGGIGIPNPVATAEQAFNDSVHITRPLVDKILNGEYLLDNTTLVEIDRRKKEVVSRNNEAIKETAKQVALQLPDHLRRLTKLNSEKGSSCWLTSLPLIECGFYLNKQAFVDALCLRYGWKVKGMANFCACGTKNTTP